jgi:hypothetical protein
MPTLALRAEQSHCAGGWAGAKAEGPRKGTGRTFFVSQPALPRFLARFHRQKPFTAASLLRRSSQLLLRFPLLPSLLDLRLAYCCAAQPAVHPNRPHILVASAQPFFLIRPIAVDASLC